MSLKKRWRRGLRPRGKSTNLAETVRTWAAALQCSWDVSNKPISCLVCSVGRCIHWRCRNPMLPVVLRFFFNFHFVFIRNKFCCVGVRSFRTFSRRENEDWKVLLLFFFHLSWPRNSVCPKWLQSNKKFIFYSAVFSLTVYLSYVFVWGFS